MLAGALFLTVAPYYTAIIHYGQDSLFVYRKQDDTAEERWEILIINFSLGYTLRDISEISLFQERQLSICTPKYLKLFDCFSRFPSKTICRLWYVSIPPPLLSTSCGYQLSCFAPPFTNIDKILVDTTLNKSDVL